MTEKQYIKYLMNVNLTPIKIYWCDKCKQKGKCDKKLKEECVVRFEKKHHKDEWTFEIGLARENEKKKH